MVSIQRATLAPEQTTASFKPHSSLFTSNEAEDQDSKEITTEYAVDGIVGQKGSLQYNTNLENLHIFTQNARSNHIRIFINILSTGIEIENQNSENKERRYIGRIPV